MSSQTAITVGNFDGVHLGHARLVQSARKVVGDKGRVVVLSFDPHPISILKPEAVPSRLSLFERRSLWLKSFGVDEVIRLVPDSEFLNLPAKEFLARLTGDYQPGFIVEGPDFHFGYRRTGSVATLKENEAKFGYETVVIDPVDASLSDLSIVRVSSSIIRWMLGQGRVADASRLLGRPYELESLVEAGEKRGREIGVPTANLAANELMLPANGIYCGRVRMPDDRIYPAAISVGTKPTFGGKPRLCEAHLIGYDGPLDDYGWRIRVEFHQWIRDQVKFSGIESLVDQLRRDIEQVGSFKQLETT